MTSLWLDRADREVFLPLAGHQEYDHVVIGAGITGLTTGLLLARSGARVAVVEARSIGAGATGNTTAKISALQGTRLSAIRSKHSDETLRAYADANVEGQQWLLRFCADHDVATQLRTAYTYATTEQGEQSVRSELEAAEAAGLGVRWDHAPPLPFETSGAVALDDQAQFDPMDYLAAVVAELVGHGGRVFEGSRVRRLRSGKRPTLELDEGSVTADRVVVATGTPVFDRGAFFARLEPMRSYALAFDVSEPVPEGMYLSADSPSRSLRTVPGPVGERLLVGGNGHVVGRDQPTQAQYDDLVAWTQQHFPSATLTHTWSAQDYQPIDELPYVGPLTPDNDHVLVATGFSKWGMTNGVAAALALSGTILHGHMPWAAELRSWRLSELGATPTALRLNASVMVEMAKGWGAAELRPAGDAVPGEGEGWVERASNGLPEAVSTVDGVTRRCSAVCTHLKGIVRWNDAERSWDCPLHGSRFDASGELLEGPATKDLAAHQNRD